MTRDLKHKSKTPYKVRTLQKSTKDVDTNSRVVSGMFNSYFYIDSDLDMLLPNCASKSIKERGVGSTKGNKIKHLKDHSWNENIARIDVLEEKSVLINGLAVEGIYHESFYPESTDSNDMLIKIQSGLYDSRSIGFQYDKIVMCERDSDNDDHYKNWQTYYPMAINQDKADETGFFWAVKEIILWEGSDVSFGANELTPMLGMKSKDKNLVKNQLYSKLDICNSLFKTGKLTDEGFHTLDMEMKQIKSYIANIIDSQPSKKDTRELSRENIDTEPQVKRKRIF